VALFIVLLVFSIAAAAMFVLGDYGIGTKATVTILVASSACLQFVPQLQQSVPFAVPMLMQLIVCGWWYIASRLE